jgi:hypothetical protein
MCLGESVRRLAEVGRELAHGAQVRLLGAFAQARQLQVLMHALAQSRGAGGNHEQPLSKRGMRPTPRKMPGYPRTTSSIIQPGSRSNLGKRLDDKDLPR